MCEYGSLSTMPCFQDALHFLAEVDAKESVTFLAAKAKSEDDLECLECVVRSISPTKHADMLEVLAEMADRKEFRIHVAAMAILRKFPRQAIILIFFHQIDRVNEYMSAAPITDGAPNCIEFAPHNILRELTGENFGESSATQKLHSTEIR
jgi:hypothetical protein